MRKKNRLYTANKWNQPLFADVDRIHQNIFDGEYSSSLARWDRLASNAYGANYGNSGYTLNDYMNSKGNNWFGLSKQNNAFSKGNIGTTMKGIGGAAATIGDTVNTGDPRGLFDTMDPVYHLAGGRESGVGNALSDTGVGLFKTGAQSGNGWLMLAGAGAKILGGLTNAAFGTKENKENVANIKQNTATARAAGSAFGNVTNENDFWTIAGNMGTQSNYGWKDLYKNGWFTKKGKKKGNALILDDNSAMSYQTHNMVSAAEDIDRKMDEIAFANSYAFGGLLGNPMFSNTGMGAIDYGFMSDYLTAKNKQAENKNTANNPFAGVANNFFSDGGGIHIKHPGRLTELKKRTGKTEAELWAEGKPEVRKMITFARNARAWSKANGGKLHRDGVEIPNFFDFGGDMQTNSSDFPTGLTHISAGGSHEESPYDGVQLGLDSQGKPNLVEEGEAIWNDYVFSNRIPIDDETKKKFHFPKKRDITYAEAAKRLEKEISERPNDPISEASFNAQMQQLEEQQERQKQEMEAARVREAFEALTPEEQAGVMQYAQQQQAQEQAMQQEAMAQQAQMQQPSPEEIVMAEQQQMMEQPMAESQMQAYGGNLFDLGGAMRFIKSKYPNLNADSLRQMAAILEKKAADRIVDKRTGRATRVVSDRDYAHVYDELNSLNSDRRFNNWVNAGLSRQAAFDLSYKKPPTSWGQSELDKYNAKRKQLLKEPERKKVWKSITGKVFNTEAEARADNTAFKNKTGAYAENKTEQAAQTQQPQLYTSENGWKFRTKEEADAATARYRQNMAKQQTAKQEEKTAESFAAEVPAKQQTGTVAKAPQMKQRAKAASASTMKNVGDFNEGDFAQHWDTYSKPGLDTYLSNLENRYNNAVSEEERNAIRNEAIEQFNGIQQSYWDNVLPGRGKSSFNYDDKIVQHQTDWENNYGNTGFWNTEEDGSVTNKIASAINLPQGHNTTDTPAGRGIDGFNGPQTNLRTFGTTEVGDDKYYAPFAERFANMGINFSPFDKWSYGDARDKKLYGLSLLDDQVPEDAYTFGDYNPDYEDEDTFEVVDENGNPTGIKASSAEAAAGVPGAIVNINPVPKHRNEWIRYAGLFGPAVGLGMQMAGIGKPDYSGLDAVVNGSGNTYLADWKPIGNYLKYDPMDIWFEQNRLNANARATDRAILNSGSNQGSKEAALLASGYNNQIASGDLYRKAREYNDAQRYQIAGFNRGTDQFNAEAYNKNSQFNTDALNRARQYDRSLAMQAASQKLASDAGWYNGIYGNVAGLFKGLSELGRENAQYNWLSDLAADGVFGSTGNSYIGKRYVDNKETKKNSAAKGGKLKKRGLTY